MCFIKYSFVDFSATDLHRFFSQFLSIEIHSIFITLYACFVRLIYSVNMFSAIIETFFSLLIETEVKRQFSYELLCAWASCATQMCGVVVWKLVFFWLNEQLQIYQFPLFNCTFLPFYRVLTLRKFIAKSTKKHPINDAPSTKCTILMRN